MTPCPAPDVPQDGKSSSAGSTSPRSAAPICSPAEAAQLQELAAQILIRPLVEAMAPHLQALAQAMAAQAQSTQDLIRAMGEGEQDPDAPATEYLDGKSATL